MSNTAAGKRRPAAKKFNRRDCAYRHIVNSLKWKIE
jgi:hypothetical protein